MPRSGLASVTLLAPLALLASSDVVRAEVTVEYLGHAAFVFESPAGIRVAIDPFNSDRWLGYRYPDDVEADAVLVTHPHYDHDAAYYFDPSVPVFREPGRFRVGDVELLGVEGRHADPYGRDFGQINTIWRVTVGGVRLVHLGDNGPLTEANVSELGRVDVLFAPADGDDHILTSAQIETIRRELGDPVVVPMHYRLPGFHDLPESLGPIDPWLAGQEGVLALDGHRASLPPKDEETRVVVFEPSPRLVAWPSTLPVAWLQLTQARQIVTNDPNQASQGIELVERAFEGGEGIAFAYHWAHALTTIERRDEAIDLLESRLASAAREDWEYRMRSHAFLADLYVASGRAVEAEPHYRIVLAGTYRTELREHAAAALSR